VEELGRDLEPRARAARARRPRNDDVAHARAVYASRARVPGG
jgi:hypothetical protein